MINISKTIQFCIKCDNISRDTSIKNCNKCNSELVTHVMIPKESFIEFKTHMYSSQTQQNNGYVTCFICKDVINLDVCNKCREDFPINADKED